MYYNKFNGDMTLIFKRSNIIIYNILLCKIFILLLRNVKSQGGNVRASSIFDPREIFITHNQIYCYTYYTSIIMGYVLIQEN